MPKALDGILVVTLEQAVAAPLVTSRLADAGARVIKLERQDGDFARGYDNYARGYSSYFAWLNRHKESCRVDLSTEADMALVLAMLEKADVFVQNLGPGATTRLGLGPEKLRAMFPRLITCDVRGYAEGTPMANRKAYDLMIQAESGLSNLTGTESSGPSRVGVSICDITTGMTAHAQILEALFARERTGQGRHISVALFDVAAEIMNIPYIATKNANATPRRIGLAHPSIVPYGAFEVADGTLLMAVQSEREWAQFCNGVLEAPELIADPRFSSNTLRTENRKELEAIINGILADKTVAQTMERLEKAKIAYGQVSTMADLIAHPAVARVTCEAGGEIVDMVGGPAVVDGERAGGGHVPALGEHDDALRREFVTSPASVA